MSGREGSIQPLGKPHQTRISIAPAAEARKLFNALLAFIRAKHNTSCDSFYSNLHGDVR